MFRMILLVIVLLAPTVHAAIAQEAWAEKFFNPKPLEDDLVLPMPCGGSMVFRPIAVPVSDILNDREVTLGGTDPRFAHSENRRFAQVAGSFSDQANPAHRLFFISKYELSDLQRAAIEGICNKPRLRARLPAVNLSWFDAVALAESFTTWIIQNAPDALPAEDGARGFVRLPTEVEWEYAARGGVAITESEFSELTFPMQDAVSKYAWYAGSDSSNGKLQLTGLLKPNPLGLHDLLGNADEIVLEPFRLNRVSRLHGQAGGFIVKGGNYLTSVGDLRSAYRQEIAHHKDDGPNRVRTIGVRFAISAPVITTRERLADIQAAWSKLPRDLSVNADVDPAGDPVEALSLILEQDLPGPLRKRLETLNLALGATLAERNEQRSRAARGVLRLGAFLSNKLKDDMKRLDAIRKIYEGRKAAGSSEDILERVRRNIDRSERAFDENLTYYFDTVIAMSRDYAQNVTEAEAAALGVEFQGQKLLKLVQLLNVFVGHVTAYRSSGRLDQDKWVDEIQSR